MEELKTDLRNDRKDIYEYMYFGDYNLVLSFLAEILLPEKWDFDITKDYFILKNYLKYTFYKLQEENKVIETESYCIFNTGLFNTYYEPIYAFGIPNDQQDRIQKWKFVGFKDRYDLGDIVITFPEKANYFNHPEDLIFDLRCPINIQYKHILDNPTNLERFPKRLQKASNLQLLLDGAINMIKKRVIANYKIAIPQYFNGRVQLLLPLCLQDSDTPDLALVISKSRNERYYQGYTCLTLEMAYNNARLITRPESNWLTYGVGFTKKIIW